MNTRKHIPAFAAIILFAGVFASVSLVNHMNFRTYAWDLGIKNNEIYDYAHFRWNDNPLISEQIQNKLGDHFSLYPLIVSPFYWIFGSGTLLIFQIISILAGGAGMYYFIYRLSRDRLLALFSMLHFFTVWGIYSALGFDYHDNVVAAMLLPWFFAFFHYGEWTKAVLFFVLILAGKENMALWGFFIGTGLILLYLKDRKKMIAGSLFALGSLIWFFAVVFMVMPEISGAGQNGYGHFNYPVLGKDPSSATRTLMRRPFYVLFSLFTNHSGNPDNQGIKRELFSAFLLSGGILLFLRPQFLWMLLPVFGQKLLHDDPVKWGLSLHYSIELVPLIGLGSFYLVRKLPEGWKRYLAASLLVLSAGSTTFMKMEDRNSCPFRPARFRFYHKLHYRREFNPENVRRALESVPAGASVSAQDFLVPRLAFRDSIFLFPGHWKEASFIVLSPLAKSTFPATGMQYDLFLYNLLCSPLYEASWRGRDAVVFRRKKTDSEPVLDKPEDIEGVTVYCDSMTRKIPPRRYRSAFVLEKPEPGNFYRVSAKRRPDSGTGKLIISGNSEPSFYRHISREIPMGKEQDLLVSFYMVPLDFDGDRIKIDYWNASGDTVYFEDFLIIAAYCQKENAPEIPD